jgi:preprotein translocase subunit SecB
MKNSPGLTYLGFEVLKIVFDRGDYTKESNSGQFKVSVRFSCDVNSEDKNDFISSFIVLITNEQYHSFTLQVEAYGKFLIEGNASDDIYTNFTEISAPSIVYPYLRAFVSTVVLQSGLKPLFLPSLNFADKKASRDITKKKFSEAK